MLSSLGHVWAHSLAAPAAATAGRLQIRAIIRTLPLDDEVTLPSLNNGQSRCMGSRSPVQDPGTRAAFGYCIEEVK